MPYDCIDKFDVARTVVVEEHYRTKLSKIFEDVMRKYMEDDHIDCVSTLEESQK